MSPGISLSEDEERRVHLLVASDEVGPVSTWLIEQGVRFDEDDRAGLQRVLDAYPPVIGTK